MRKKKKRFKHILYKFMENIYMCIWTGYINRYNNIAEGLLFITKVWEVALF